MEKRFDKYESEPDAISSINKRVEGDASIKLAPSAPNKNGLQCNPLLGEKFPIKLSSEKTRDNKSKARP